MPKIDFGGTEGSSFAPLPKGTYRVRMETMISGKSKSSDNRQLELTMIVDEPDSQYNGRQLKDWFVLTPAAGWKLHGFLDACIPGNYEQEATGEKNDKGKPMFRYSFDTDDIIGEHCMVRATIEEDNKQQERNRFRYMAMDEAKPADKPAEGASNTAKEDEAPPARRERRIS